MGTSKRWIRHPHTKQGEDLGGLGVCRGRPTHHAAGGGYDQNEGEKEQPRHVGPLPTPGAQRPDAWCPVPGAQCLVPGAWCLVLSSDTPVPLRSCAPALLWLLCALSRAGKTPHSEDVYSHNRTLAVLRTLYGRV